MNSLKFHITVAVFLIATVFSFGQDNMPNWKLDLEMAFQKHDDRIVLFRHFAKGAGVYQINLMGSRLFYNKAGFSFYYGAGFSIEHMTTTADFNGLIFDEIIGDLEIINRYTKVLFLVNSELAYRFNNKYSLHLQLQPQLGLFRKVKNTREIPNTINYSGTALFYNNSEINVFVSRSSKNVAFKLGYRIAHLKSDDALFFENMSKNVDIPQEDWVHNKTFDVVNPLKLFIGVSFPF